MHDRHLIVGSQVLVTEVRMFQKRNIRHATHPPSLHGCKYSPLQWLPPSRTACNYQCQRLPTLVSGLFQSCAAAADKVFAAPLVVSLLQVWVEGSVTGATPLLTQAAASVMRTVSALLTPFPSVRVVCGKCLDELQLSVGMCLGPAVYMVLPCW